MLFEKMPKKKILAAAGICFLAGFVIFLSYAGFFDFSKEEKEKEGKIPETCGNGLCQEGETVWNCCHDCGVPEKRCSWGETTKEYLCQPGSQIPEEKTFDCNQMDKWIDEEDYFSCCREKESCSCQKQAFQDYACKEGACSFSYLEARTLYSDCTCQKGFCGAECTEKQTRSCGAEGKGTQVCLEDCIWGECQGDNSLPVAGFSCSVAGCSVYSGSNDPRLDLKNTSFDKDGSSDILQSRWDILDHQGYKLTCPGKCDYVVQSTHLSPGDYKVILEVKDRQGAKSSFEKKIIVKEDVLADFMCSLDNIVWEDCSEFEAIQKDYVYFKDSSSLKKHSWPSEKAASIVSRSWKFNGDNFGAGINPQVRATGRENTVELEVVDNIGRKDVSFYTFRGKLPPPTWREIGI